jgi:LemA protein
MASRSRSLWILLAIIIVLGGWIASGYNGLVSSKENVTNEWAKVESQYQRRFDLVPNLVNTVKGAANFEQQTLLGVTEARTKWLNAGSVNERIDAAQGFESALSRLLVTVEAYPQLQATQAFRDLMTQLEGTENRIAVARMDYNNAVLDYNQRVKRFPGNVLAGMFGFAPEKAFDATPGAENAPPVDFSNP